MLFIDWVAVLVVLGFGFDCCLWVGGDCLSCVFCFGFGLCVLFVCLCLCGWVVGVVKWWVFVLIGGLVCFCVR